MPVAHRNEEPRVVKIPFLIYIRQGFMAKKLPLYAIIIFSLIACAEQDAPTSSWDTAFSVQDSTELTMPDSLVPQSSVRALAVVNDSLIAMPDGGSARIVLREKDGTLKQTIGESGEGPGEFEYLAYIAADEAGNVYGYDVAGYRISVFSQGEDGYAFERRFSLSNEVVDMMIMGDHLYTLSSTGDYLLTKYTLEGDMVSETLEPSGSDYQTFAARFNLGGMTSLGDSLLAVVTPATDAIHFYEDDLSVAAQVDDLQDLPEVPAFPDGLNPYDYTDEHAEWWSASWHPIDVHAVTDMTYGIVSYKPDGQDIEGQRMHLFSAEDDELLMTVDIPDSMFIVHADGRNLFGSLDPTSENGTEIATRLIRYAFE